MSQKNKTSGRGRGNPKNKLPGAQPVRFEEPSPKQPEQNGAHTPRGLRQPAQVPQKNNVVTKDMPTPLGRGVLRGHRDMDSELVEHFRMPRPVSSCINGKQGNIGQQLDLVANYFPIKSCTNWSLYQYKINFSPDEDSIVVKRGLLGVHRKKLGAYIFDGSMLFGSTKYDSKEFKLSSKRTSDDRIVTITVIFTSVLQSSDYAYIQVFNLLLRNTMRHLNLTLVGRNYYDSAAKVNIPNHKLQLWPGYETTINMFDSGLLLRVDISTKVMRDETLHEFFRDCVNNSRKDFMDNFKAGVIGSVVLTRYNNQNYKIDDVDESVSPKNTFKMRDGTSMTYIDYYKKKWNITIRDRNQPMLISKKKKSFSMRVFNEDMNNDLIYLIPELCCFTGLSEAMSKNFRLMKDLSDFTKVNPTERVKKYHNFLNRIQSTTESMSSLNDWGLKLDKDLVKVKGRILSKQNVYSNNKVYESGKEADWTKYVRSNPMFLSAKIQCWAVLYPQQNNSEMQEFLRAVQKVANEMSFKFPQPIFYPINAGSVGAYRVLLEQIINQMNPSFILCITQSQRGDIYNIIKQHLCITRAVPSQVVLLKNVIQVNMSVCTKVAVQINCKLGGAPWKISIPTKGIMIIGFDVCHLKQRRDRSFGALVASINDDHTLYYNCVLPHSSGEELSNNFAVSISGALTAYRNHNKKLPAMIIIYRDGVGDGQISHVHKTEIKLVKEAFRNFYDKGTEPPMAFIIVKKRIGTRYFSLSGSSFWNPPPGTVVDSVITDPTMYDFFLVSQYVKSCAATPTHYNVIVDTLLDWSPNKMQMLTYKLTHMYYNWSGTVRVPAHCQFAHKLAFMTGQSLQSTPNTALSERLFFL